jgi:hypothetical protein
MAEKTLENQFCRTCQADIRAGALFCYSCGSSVALDLSNGADALNDRAAISEAKESDYKNKEDNSLKNVEAASAVTPIGKPMEKPLMEPIPREKAEIKDKKLIVQKETKLKTAASLRQNPKKTKRETVEIVWEAPETSRTLWFVAASLILVLFAVGILLAMLSLR